MLFIGSCLLVVFVGCCSLAAICWLPFVGCHLLAVICWLSFVGSCLLAVNCWMSFVAVTICYHLLAAVCWLFCLSWCALVVFAGRRGGVTVVAVNVKKSYTSFKCYLPCCHYFKALLRLTLYCLCPQYLISIIYLIGCIRNNLYLQQVVMSHLGYHIYRSASGYLRLICIRRTI